MHYSNSSQQINEADKMSFEFKFGYAEIDKSNKSQVLKREKVICFEIIDNNNTRSEAANQTPG